MPPFLDRIISRWRRDAGDTFRLAAIGAVSLACATVAFSFLCAAALIVAIDRYGAVDACLGAAAVFLAAAVVLLLVRAGLARRRRIQAVVKASQEPTAPSLLADPRALMLGLQIVQAIGPRRLLPIAAIVGSAFVLFSTWDGGPSRRARRAAGDRPDDSRPL